MNDLSHLAVQGCAVITGAASGIGFATAQRLAQKGFALALVDLAGDRLNQAVTALAKLTPAKVLGLACDVSSPAEIQALASKVQAEFGAIAILMNNAAIQPGSSVLEPQNWSRVLDTNLGSVIHGCQTFVPLMQKQGTPGLIINTGSKQGITTPPGDPAYNVAKAGVKVFTEALQHQLRNTPGNQLSAHLLIPGFVFTGLTAHGRAQKPAGAWTADQTADFLLASLERGDFYILCPDNDVPRALDEKRIAWAAGDIIENRPPLSRWHADFTQAFADHLKK